RRIRVRRRWAVEHNNSRHLDIIKSIYRVKSIRRTKIYMAATAQLAIAVAAAAIGRPDKARSYRTMIAKNLIMNQAYLYMFRWCNNVLV
ncbi:MAG: hypothetical protein QXH35_08235, partial [Nitrososphaerota archaeon]